jgi:hypothetical protein
MLKFNYSNRLTNLTVSVGLTIRQKTGTQGLFSSWRKKFRFNWIKMNVARYMWAASYMRRTVDGWWQRSEKPALFFKPVMAPILQDPIILRITIAIVLIQLLITLFGVQGWKCPVQGTVGLPCPGCGLSAAMVSLILGDWRTAVSTHAFAPLFVIAIVFMVILSFLPRRSYRVVVQRLAVLESNSGLTGLFLTGFIGYWGLRFIF